MKPRIAYQTLKAFEEQVKVDQGARYRGWLQKVLPHIGDAYRTDEDGFRSHLGASLLGHECARSIWYNFRWVHKSDFTGRMVRLFNRGHLEEGRIIALFLTIGCQIFQQDENGKQFRISWAEGHAGGSGDGIVLDLPDVAQGTYAITEYKTHGEKSFIELAGKLDEWRKHLLDPQKNPFTGKGVREAKFEHYVQMNLYMKKMGIPLAIYVAVNKNTDDIYAELLVLDNAVADQFLARGEKLVWMDKAPSKINISPGFYKCSFCDFKPVCHLNATPHRNCRTCECSEPRAGAKWFCRYHNKELTVADQLAGCGDYRRKQDI